MYWKSSFGEEIVDFSFMAPCYPILMDFPTFSSLIVYCLVFKTNAFSKVILDISQWQAMFHNDIGSNNILQNILSQILDVI